MDLFIVVTPDVSNVSKDVIAQAYEKTEKNLNRSIFFSHEPVGTEKVFIYSEKTIGVEFYEHTERLILDYYKLGKGAICSIDQMSFEEVVTTSPKIATLFFVVTENKVEALFKKLSSETYGNAYKDLLLSPLSSKEKFIPGEVVFIGRVFDNVFSACYLSEYDLLDTFHVEGQFKLSAISTGRSALQTYLRMKDAGKDFSENMKEAMKTGLKKMHTGIGKFIENIDK